MSAILTLSLLALLAGHSQTAAHDEPRYAEARDRAYGAAIDQARQVIHLRLDEYLGRRGSVGLTSKAGSASGPLRGFAWEAWPSR